MLLRELFEGPSVDAAFCFGRFNPAHKGHIEVWKAVQGAGKQWYVGTNPKTIGANDPLDFNTKSAWMEAIYPEIEGHILPEQSVVTLASRLFEILGKNTNATIAYVTDSNDWAWAGKLLNDYNGKEGPHGYYKFRKILHVESPRVSSATALRTAARAGDEAAFYAASGTDPKLTVNGKTYYDTVADALQAHPEKVKKPAKKKVAEPVEGVAEGKSHISPSGVKTTMDPQDDDYEINYGKNGLVAKFRKDQGVDVKTGSKKVKESLRPGEYHVATVTLDNGDVKKFKVTWDEGYQETIKKFYAKQGHTVVDIDMDWSIHVSY